MPRGQDVLLHDFVRGCKTACYKTRSVHIAAQAVIGTALPDCKWWGVACGSQRRLRRLKALQAAPLQVSNRREVFQRNQHRILLEYLGELSEAMLREGERIAVVARGSGVDPQKLVVSLSRDSLAACTVAAG
jgi:hypothetical protein